MAESTIKLTGLQGFKTYIKENVSFTFTNSIYSNEINLSTLTNSIVTSTNVIGVITVGLGWSVYGRLATGKTAIQGVTAATSTGTYSANIILIYR